jgi:uncharacterized membrane protein YcaP (DUF421 family)
MSLIAIAVRSLACYCYLLALVRMSGKRTVWQGSPLDFVVALILGDLVDDFLWAEVGAAEFCVATAILIATHLVVKEAVAASSWVRRWIEGVEAPVIEEGSFVPGPMRGERMNEAEIFALLRMEGESDMREVKSADIELSGELSVLKHQWARPVQEMDREETEKAHARNS